MIEYQVGPDDPGVSVESKNYEWIVHEYYQGDYDGSGDAVAKGKDGLMYHWNLGHCSCYGPFSESYETKPLDEFLKNESILDWGLSQELRAKIHELLLGV